MQTRPRQDASSTREVRASPQKPRELRQAWNFEAGLLLLHPPASVMYSADDHVHHTDDDDDDDEQATAGTA